MSTNVVPIKMIFQHKQFIIRSHASLILYPSADESTTGADAVPIKDKHDSETNL